MGREKRRDMRRRKMKERRDMRRKIKERKEEM